MICCVFRVSGVKAPGLVASLPLIIARCCGDVIRVTEGPPHIPGDGMAPGLKGLSSFCCVVECGVLILGDCCDILCGDIVPGFPDCGLPGLCCNNGVLGLC